MNGFYSNIEKPIRDIVRELRDNGINTTCSCGHDMTIQADLIVSGELQIIHNTLFNHLIEGNPNISYDIEVKLEVRKGMLWRCWADIIIGENKLEG